MILNTLLFFITSLLILLSTLGYGLIFANNIFKKNDYLNLSFKGILGIFFLYIISSITHLFLPHNYLHNSIILIIGLLLFYNCLNKGLVEKKYLNKILIIFACLFLGLLISKTNEDFPYYHLPNSLQFSSYKLEFGLGHLSHGFKHFSSIFLINSIFYLPFFEVYLFNITNFMLQVFFFSGLIILINKSNINNFSKIIISIALITYLVKFYRLAEYGADYLGQFLVLLGFIFASFSFSNNLRPNKKKQIFLTSLIFFVFAITTKFLYAIYIIIPLFLFIYLFKMNEIIKYLLDKKFFLVSLVSMISVFFFNFTSTGCFLYPITFTCLTDTIDWSISESTIKTLNLHYKAWSKAGVGAGYGISNHQEYIAGINWVNNWIEKYFFTKVSDYILVVLFICLIFILSLKKNFVKKKKLDFSVKSVMISYFSILIVLLLWFFNFPTLRYAGYSIVFLVLAAPFSLFLAKRINFNDKNVIKKINLLIILAFIAFNFKNIQRLNKELNLNINEHHNFSNFPFFWVDEVKYNKILIKNKYFYEITNNKPCWNVPSTCIKDISQLEIKTKNGYFFYKTK